MPVHHLLKPDIGRIYCARRPSERAPIPECKFGWNGGDGTSS
jgi:hypothetical protein